MEQVLIGGHRNSLHATSTEYNTLAGANNWVPSAFIGSVISADGEIKNLKVQLSGAPGAGKSYTFAVEINGVASDVEVVIADTDTYGENLIDTVVVAAGNMVRLKVVPSGTPSTCYAYWTSVFDSEMSAESLILGGTGGTTLDWDDIEYARVMGAGSKTEAVEDDFRQVIPTSGTLKKFYVELTETPGSGADAYRFTVRLNGATVAQSLIVTISAPDTTGSDLVHNLAVIAGDTLTMMIEPLNTPSEMPRARWGMTFLADIDGESIIISGSSYEPSTSSNNYNQVYTDSVGGWSSNEAYKLQLGQTCTVKKLHMLLSGAPGAGKKYTFNIRLGQAASNVIAIVQDTDTTGDSGALEDDIAAHEYIDLESDPDAGPAAAAVYWGLVCYIEPPPPEPTEKTWQIDTLFRVLGQRAASYDTVFKRHEVPKTPDLDAIFNLRLELQRQFDSLFQREFEEGRVFDFVADGIQESSAPRLAYKVISNFGEAHSVTELGDYLYYCSRRGGQPGKVLKINKTDYDDFLLVTITRNATEARDICDIQAGAGYIWVGDKNGYLYKLDPADLSTVSYYYIFDDMVPGSYLDPMHTDGTYIYMATTVGLTAKHDISAETHIHGTVSPRDAYTYCHAMDGDATHLYIADHTNRIFYKILKSDLSMVDWTDIKYACSDDICLDDDYVYIGIEMGTGRTVRVKKSDLSTTVHTSPGQGVSDGTLLLGTHIVNIGLTDHKLWIYNANGLVLFKKVYLEDFWRTWMGECLYDGTYIHAASISYTEPDTVIYRYDANDVLRSTWERRPSLDAWFKAIGVEEAADFDALFKRYGVERTAAIDAFLVLSFKFLRQFDAYFKAIGVERPANVDAWFKRLEIEKTAPVDTAFRRRDIGAPTDVDTVFIVRMALQRQLDAYFKAIGVERTADLDAVYKALDVEKTLDVDTLFRRLGIGIDATIDTLFKRLDIPITTAMDAYFKILGVEKTTPMDVLFKKLDIPKLALLDAIFATPIERAMALDAIFFRTDILRTLLINAAFQRQGIEKTADVDALIVLHTEPPLLLDAVFFGQDIARSVGLDVQFGFWTFIFISTHLTSDKVEANLTDKEVEADLTPTDVKARLG